ncbi:hypothetical protein GCM10010191_40960 [Actinomadura vinacea]|uniref:Uncharacterized protein n=1 Tax=Actinomadura vinacea TaxID=115336 RepID=A0ABP5WEZ5_9ACTN
MAGLGDLPPALDLLRQGMHLTAPFRVRRRIACRAPPAVDEVVQHAQIQGHADLVEHGLKAGVERFAVFWHNEGGPDGTQALPWHGRAAW